jgi:hypothetical protein
VSLSSGTDGRLRTLRGFFVSLVAAFVSGGLLAASADAAWYKESRPGLTIALRTQGHRVAELKARYTQHCSDGSLQTTIEQRPEFNRPINQQTGRFGWRFGSMSDAFTRVERGRGTVRPEVITGRFLAKDTTTLGGDTVRCWTGHSIDEPGISFVARRL